MSGNECKAIGVGSGKGLQTSAGIFCLEKDPENANYTTITFQAYTSQNFNGVYNSAEKVAKQNGLVIASRDAVKKEVGLTGELVRRKQVLQFRAERADKLECAPIMPEHRDTVELSSAAILTYDLYPNRSTLIEETLRRGRSGGTVDAKGKSEFARRIYDALVEKGIIKRGTRFEPYFLGIGGIEKTIVSSIQDRDNDGCLDLDTAALLSQLGRQGALNDQNTTALDLQRALVGVTTRYFADKPGTPVAAPSGRFKDYTYAQFLQYIERAYRGKLSHNPELQQQLTADISSFLDDHFIGSMEDGKEIGVADEAVVFPANLDRSFSRNRYDQFRIDCKGYGEVAAEICARAGLEIRVYGTFIKPTGETDRSGKTDGTTGSGHVVVVAHLPCERGVFYFDNGQIIARAELYDEGTAQGEVATIIKKTWGEQVRIYDITSGGKTFQEIASIMKLKQDAKKLLATGLQGMSDLLAEVEITEQPKNYAWLWNRLQKIDGQLQEAYAVIDRQDAVMPIWVKIDNEERYFANRAELISFLKERQEKMVQYIAQKYGINPAMLRT